jgi:hypothetical protein
MQSHEARLSRFHANLPALSIAPKHFREFADIVREQLRSSEQHGCAAEHPRHDLSSGSRLRRSSRVSCVLAYEPESETDTKSLQNHEFGAKKAYFVPQRTTHPSGANFAEWANSSICRNGQVLVSFAANTVAELFRGVRDGAHTSLAHKVSD